MDEYSYFWLLYSTLLAQVPIDTRNMQNSMFYEVNEELGYYDIVITAISKKGYDYARAVNYALAAKAQGRPMSVKESHNLNWVERVIKQVSDSTTGGRAEYEL